MPVPFRFLSLLGSLLCALAFTGCAADTLPDETGDATIRLELADGTEIDEVQYSVTGNEMPAMSGTIDTSAPGSTASIEIYGIPEGQDYLVTLTATSTDGATSCSGSAFFDVAVGRVTNVMVILNCKLPQRFGGVRVNGKLNVCAALAKVVVSPLQTSVGSEIDVFAHASDFEGDAIAYRWTASSGSFMSSTAPITTYTCEESGDHLIAIAVSDDDFMHCEHSWTVEVTCVGDSGAGGTGGAGGGTGGAPGGGGAGGVAGAGGAAGAGGTAGTGGMGGTGGTAGTAGAGGAGGAAGAGGTAGAGGEGGSGGTAGTAGAGGAGGVGGTAGTGGMGGVGGVAGMGGAGGVAGMGGAGGVAGMGGAGGVAGMGGAGGVAGMGGAGGVAGMGGAGGMTGAGGAGGTAGTAGGGGSSGGDNICPRLFIINAIPSTIQPGQTTTMVETRGQDTDGVPMPLVLTLRALWGSFQNTDNIQLPNNVVAQNATYICDRPGPVELCVDATDGACVKTLCTNVTCPDDVP